MTISFTSTRFFASDAGSPLLGAASVVLAAATAPLLIELLTLTVGSLLPNRIKGPAIQHSAAPLALAVVVPAHNEALLVERCVHSLRADLPADDISSVLVIAHNCQDATAAVAAAAGAEVLVLNDDGSEGKGAALRAGFAHAAVRGAQVVAVVDADSVVDPGFSAAIANAIGTGAEAFQARYVVRNGEGDARTRLTALGFLGFNVIRPRGRSRLGLSAGIFGNGFGMRSSILERVPYEASSLVEDLEYHLRLVQAGIKVTFLDDATVSSEMPSTAAAVSSQRARWEGGRSRMARVWLPRLIVPLVGGRLRLLEPMLELASLPLANEVLLLAISLLLPVPWLRIYSMGAFAILFGHVTCAAAEGTSGRIAIKTLLSVPGYILWKLRMLPRILASSRRNAAWVRTARDNNAAAHELSARELVPTGAAEGSR